MKSIPARIISSGPISVHWSRAENKILMKFGKLVYLFTYEDARKFAEIIEFGEGDLHHFHVDEYDKRIIIKADGYKFVTDYKQSLVYAIRSEIGEACRNYSPNEEEEA